MSNTKTRLEKGVREMGSYKQVMMALVVLGAINWGLVGVVGVNVVSAVLGEGSILERIVYVLIGLSGAMMAWEKWGGKK